MPHTPGPWEAYCMGSEGYIVKRDNRGLPAATVKAELRDRTTPIAYVMGRDFDTQKADAYLMAAAPDSLEACEYLVKGLTNLLEKGPLQSQPAEVLSVVNDADRLARVAIAKAKG